MPLNRELLASLTFEPSGGSDDSSSDDGRKPVERAEDVDNDEEAGQNEATKLVIHCLKLALAESIISISHPGKQRLLNPKDFSIEATTVFRKRTDTSGSGVACCGPRSVRIKKRRHSRASGELKHRRRQTGAAHLYRWIHDSDELDDAGGNDPGLRAGGQEDGLGTGGPTVRSETASAQQRRRRSGGLGRGADATTIITEDDDYEDEEEDDAPRVNFKFVDYSPMCYRHIREMLGVDPKEYCDVLRYSRWHSIPTPGKSAAQLFFCGRDWVIKTMTNQESEFLRNIVHRYYYHVRDNPYTLLPHFVGHHRLEIGTEAHNVIIMQNVFATTNTIHEKFDLKGSTIGRYASEAERLKATCTQKDLDIHRPLHVGPERRQLLIDQVRADCTFLKLSRIMDYSFLLGVHVLPQGRSVVANTHGSTPASHGLSATLKPSGAAGGPLTGESMGQSRPPLYEDGRCFVADQGGMMSNDIPGLRKEIYYIGIIDILQEYNTRKRLETAFFGARHDYQRISCVNPTRYAARFIDFMTSIIV